MRNEKITYKIREHSLQKVPYILVVGDKEKAGGAVAVRARGNQDLGVMPLADFAQKLAESFIVMERGEVVVSGRREQLADPKVRKYLVV